MRILCTSTPMEGVVGPLLPIAQALRERGHDVLLVVGPDVRERVEESGFAPVIVGPSAMEAVMRSFAEPDAAASPGTSPAFAAAMFGGVFAPDLLPALRTVADEFVPDVIVHPPVEVASPIIAVERGIGNVTYGFGQVLDAAIVDAIATRVAPLWTSAGLPADPFAGIYGDCYLDPCPAGMRIGAIAPARLVQPIRPEIPGRTTDELPADIAQLGERPILYITLGTVPLFNQLATFDMLFDAVAEMDIDVVATIGANNDPAALGFPPGERPRAPMAAAPPAAGPVRCRDVPRRFRNDTRRVECRSSPRGRAAGCGPVRERSRVRERRRCSCARAGPHRPHRCRRRSRCRHRGRERRTTGGRRDRRRDRIDADGGRCHRNHRDDRVVQL